MTNGCAETLASFLRKNKLGLFTIALLFFLIIGSGITILQQSFSLNVSLEGSLLQLRTDLNDKTFYFKELENLKLTWVHGNEKKLVYQGSWQDQFNLNEWLPDQFLMRDWEAIVEYQKGEIIITLDESTLTEPLILTLEVSFSHGWNSVTQTLDYEQPSTYVGVQYFYQDNLLVEPHFDQALLPTRDTVIVQVLSATGEKMEQLVTLHNPTIQKLETETHYQFFGELESESVFINRVNLHQINKSLRRCRERPVLQCGVVQSDNHQIKCKFPRLRW